ncbi:type IV secretion system protein [Bartonella gabonensis]|uniref:type IV secretion system protein n=1 Tax=Bartonella gabonensis TaxID=2699889 RepID=UPI00158A176F|nr:type IV secretion system protein [Bartonella gabonensis]
MKKQVISITVAVTLGLSNPAIAGIWGAGAADLGASIPKNWPNFNWFGSSSSTPSPKKTPSPPKQNKPVPVTPVIDLLKKQLEETKKIHASITGSQKFDAKKLKNTQSSDSSFFLKDPETLYNRNASSALSTSLENILKEEEISVSAHESRSSIGKRIQYASIIDKAVSLKSLQNANNRFQQIEELLNEIKTTKDLKSIAELQANIIGMLAMLQNETAKLQMVTHLRNAEHTLIKQQKNKHNIKILSSQNTKMPTIRFIR